MVTTSLESTLDPTIPGESSDTWVTLSTQVRESLSPEGGAEIAIAERIALILWRLSRLAKYEADMIALAVEEARNPLPPAGGELDFDYSFGKKKPSAVEGKVREERDRKRAVVESTFLSDSDREAIAVTERNLSRELTRAFRQLRVLQTLRNG
jgi:hypothetical protein